MLYHDAYAEEVDGPPADTCGVSPLHQASDSFISKQGSCGVMQAHRAGAVIIPISLLM